MWKGDAKAERPFKRDVVAAVGDDDAPRGADPGADAIAKLLRSFHRFLRADPAPDWLVGTIREKLPY